MPRPMNPKCAGGCGRLRRIGPEFYVGENGLPRQKCKVCLAEDAKKWRLENPEKYKAYHRPANHRTHLKNRFGLTVEEFNVLVAKTDGLCGICRQPESRGRRLSLDHDHKTGELRGFLCSKCNLLLGNAGDSEDMLGRAVLYLKATEFPRTSEVDPPVPMILNCPACRARHIDVGEFATRVHHTHACQNCGLVWRPAIVPTVGVESLPGFKNP